MTYQEHSKNVANEFIQSIAFIDDRAYQSSDTSNRDLHDFDAQAISLAFAKHEKLCAVYQPAKKEDIDSFSKLAQKADVTVIDWQINLSEPLGIDSQSNEEDDETDDERGQYTKQIIVELLKNNRNGLKLIVVYTGETDLAGITENIRKDLKTSEISLDLEESEGTCTITASPYFKILVIGKNNSAEVTEGKVNYKYLPDFILTEFAKLTAGLLSNFALQSLAKIRQNFYQILALFPAELDKAYLANQSLLGIEDTNEQLIEVLGDTFISILRANRLQNPLDKNRVHQWIESQDDLCMDKAKALYKPGIIKNKIRTVCPSTSVKSDIKCNDKVMDVFKVKEDENKKLARLFHHKNLIVFDGHTPILSLGTVVKSIKEGDEGLYYVCIQQRCDSVRLTSDEPRRFLFLSLKKAESGWNLITRDGTNLKIDKKTYGIRTVKFKGTGEVVAQRGSEGESSQEPKLYFTPFHEGDETFEFIFELKDLYAQRIVSEYSANLTRVGLDESEWMRIHSK